jgi:hypothetical protein
MSVKRIIRENTKSVLEYISLILKSKQIVV